MKVEQESVINIVRQAKDLLDVLEDTQSVENFGLSPEKVDSIRCVNKSYLSLIKAIKEFKSTNYKLNNTGEYSLSQMKVMGLI